MCNIHCMSLGHVVSNIECALTEQWALVSMVTKHMSWVPPFWRGTPLQREAHFTSIPVYENATHSHAGLSHKQTACVENCQLVASQSVLCAWARIHHAFEPWRFKATSVLYCDMQPATRPQGSSQEVLQADSAAYMAAERVPAAATAYAPQGCCRALWRCRDQSRSGAPCRAAH